MNNLLWLELIGWLATGLNIWGNLAIGNKSTKGWLIRLVCNILFIIYSVAFSVWPLLGNHIIFAGINIYNWKKWRKDQYVCLCGKRYDLTKDMGNCICEIPIRKENN